VDLHEASQQCMAIHCGPRLGCLTGGLSPQTGTALPTQSHTCVTHTHTGLVPHPRATHGPKLTTLVSHATSQVSAPPPLAAPLSPAPTCTPHQVTCGWRPGLLSVGSQAQHLSFPWTPPPAHSMGGPRSPCKPAQGPPPGCPLHHTCTPHTTHHTPHRVTKAS